MFAHILKYPGEPIYVEEFTYVLLLTAPKTHIIRISQHTSTVELQQNVRVLFMLNFKKEFKKLVIFRGR